MHARTPVRRLGVWTGEIDTSTRKLVQQVGSGIAHRSQQLAVPGFVLGRAVELAQEEQVVEVSRRGVVNAAPSLPLRASGGEGSHRPLRAAAERVRVDDKHGELRTGLRQPYGTLKAGQAASYDGDIGAMRVGAVDLTRWHR